jgi:hypothetical protein
MDQTTQQNAALVEEMAAAASSLKSQAQDLVQVVAAFKLEPGSYQSDSSSREPAMATPVSRSTGATRVQPRLAQATKPQVKPVAKALR